jgi:hypothetical protein
MTVCPFHPGVGGWAETINQVDTNRLKQKISFTHHTHPGVLYRTVWASHVNPNDVANCVPLVHVTCLTCKAKSRKGHKTTRQGHYVMSQHGDNQIDVRRSTNDV